MLRARMSLGIYTVHGYQKVSGSRGGGGRKPAELRPPPAANSGGQRPLLSADSGQDELERSARNPTLSRREVRRRRELDPPQRSAGGWQADLSIGRKGRGSLWGRRGREHSAPGVAVPGPERGAGGASSTRGGKVRRGGGWGRGCARQRGRGGPGPGASHSATCPSCASPAPALGRLSTAYLTPPLVKKSLLFDS
ncbi:hypothetical protein P7K49_003864 [Saguinus oedipus]|uniref:Uncharacterized protein n=1 Tax=Saguinus oedipus TaxID=9490 RepID=A0ABQ9W847_SAGOE|nr:hypothetical protein P7K49_003864 [Saguinus oedipus]